MGLVTSWTVSSAGAHVRHSTSKNDAIQSPPPGDRIPATHSPDSGEKRPSSCLTALAYSSSAVRAGIVSTGRDSAMQSKHSIQRQLSIAKESASPTESSSVCEERAGCLDPLDFLAAFDQSSTEGRKSCKVIWR